MNRKAAPQEPRRERDEREAVEHLERVYQFLVTDFGFVALGRLPVNTAEVHVRAYRNAAAGVQVELSGAPMSATLFGGVRRLRDGVPAPYDHHTFISFEEIAMVRQPAFEDLVNHNLHPRGRRGAVEDSARLLRDNADLLNGTGWVSLDSIFEKWKQHFLKTFGWAPASYGASLLEEYRAAFAFLLDRGYVLAYDSETLTPHEYSAPAKLRYEKGSHWVTIHRGDIRDNDWRVTCDGFEVGAVFSGRPEEIADRAKRVAALIS